ncbi:unnamed protein product [Auanema sp. JU1783]|nr:unnamed protein product [Auanema sp. JU1783]
MLKKPLRRHGKVITNIKNPVLAPLAHPEDSTDISMASDGSHLFSRRYVISRNISRRLGKSLGRFERRHSLGRERKKSNASEIDKEHHSAVDFTEHSSNEI